MPGRVSPVRESGGATWAAALASMFVNRRRHLLAVATALAVLGVPGPASATTIELRAEASNGYRLHLKASDRNRTRARVELKRNHAIALYTVRRDIEISKRRLRFDLGPRGGVDLRFHKRTNRRCDQKVSAHHGVFRGELRFDGEHGFTTVDRSRVPGVVLLRGRCGGGGDGVLRGMARAGGAGTFPMPWPRRGEVGSHFLFGCGPEPDSYLYVETSGRFFYGGASVFEEHRWARVVRVAQMSGDDAPLRVTANGRRATLRLPGPRFDGVARYAHGRTSGDLEADLPGRGWVPMTPGKAVLDDWDSPGPHCNR